MNPERWQKLDELFHSALARPAEQREAFIAAACDGDDDLRRELESMLDHFEQAGSFIEKPAYEVGAETIVGEDAHSLVGKMLGPYQLLSVLGKGGMGEVFLAFDTKRPRRVKGDRKSTR